MFWLLIVQGNWEYLEFTEINLAQWQMNIWGLFQFKIKMYDFVFCKRKWFF